MIRTTTTSTPSRTPPRRTSARAWCSSTCTAWPTASTTSIIGIGATPTARSFGLAERFANAAVRNGIAATVADDDTGFNANGPATMTMWALGRGADALQIEIARNLRSGRADPARRTALLRTFVQVVGD